MSRTCLLAVLASTAVLPACLDEQSLAGDQLEARQTPSRPNTPAVQAVPPSRSCRRPQDLTAAINGGTITGTTVGYPDETSGTCGHSHSPERIFAVTPTASGVLFATTANPGTTFDTILSARGTCDEQGSTFACNDDCIGTGSCVSFYAQAGTTYYLVLEGYGEAVGDFELGITQDTAAYACSTDPVDITASIDAASVTGSTVGAADLEGATCGSTASGEAIFQLTPTASGVVSATTALSGTDFDTVLSARVQCGNEGSEVACNDDSIGLTSAINFYAIAGTTYYLVVQGYGSNEGAFELLVSQSGEEPSASRHDRGATPATPAVPSPGATPGGPDGPAVPPTKKLPDLRVDEAMLASSWSVTPQTVAPGECTIVEGCVDAPGDRRLLRFSTKIDNIGTGAYVLGDPVDNPAFDHDDCHGHYHYGSYAQYRLRDDHGTVVKTGGKSGFCVLDLTCDPGVTPTYDCSNQGISAGCSDAYGAGLDCQWIDITEIAAGCYTLEVEANWQRTPAEASYANNVGSTTVCFSDPVCGDGVCEDGEACDSCPTDCGACAECGDGVCDPYEDCWSCGQDCGECPTCGDGACEGKQEGCWNCEADCGACAQCGDGTCDAGENCSSCAGDCGVCECHEPCVTGDPLNPGCSQCAILVCGHDPFCCDVAWDETCVQEAQVDCGLACGV